MGKEKELEKIRNNPTSITPDRLKNLCKKYGFKWKHGSNHDIVSHDLLDASYPIPRHNPVKKYYVKNIIKMIDEVSGEGV